MAKNSKSTKQTLEQLYLDRNQTGDITFVVETKRIRAHRWVLAAASPKFKAQFYGPRPDVNEIHIPDITAAAFNEFLQFFYKESITLTIENIEAVLDLAKQSLVDEFVANCISFLISIMTIQNICWAYRIGIVYDIESLRLKCEQRISKFTREIFASEKFYECDREIILRMLKLDFLNCTEMDVFDACIAWARAKCEQTNVNADEPENLRSALGDAIYQIRFSMMSIEEFAAAHNAVEGLFMPDELVEILYMIGKLNGFEAQKFNQERRKMAAVPAACQRQMDFDDFNLFPANSSESHIRLVFEQSNWQRHSKRQQYRMRRHPY